MVRVGIFRKEWTEEILSSENSIKKGIGVCTEIIEKFFKCIEGSIGGRR